MSKGWDYNARNLKYQEGFVGGMLLSNVYQSGCSADEGQGNLIVLPPVLVF